MYASIRACVCGGVRRVIESPYDRDTAVGAKRKQIYIYIYIHTYTHTHTHTHTRAHPNSYLVAVRWHHLYEQVAAPVYRDIFYGDIMPSRIGLKK